MKQSRRKPTRREKPIQDLAIPKSNYLITPKTDTQADYMVSIEKSSVVFSTGCAGTGKTYVAIAKACEHLETGKVKQIILTRPLQDSEEDKLGILPGEIGDKFGPYIAPMLQLMYQFLGRSKVESYIKAGKITGVPLALLRGLTFDNCFIVASEMQNSTPSTMKLMLTRLGKYTTLVIDGDIKQKDIRGTSGIEDAQSKLQDLKGIEFVQFELEDIVRSDIVRFILERYET
jgi:phosphate starvation-inducible PhoH-like protein